MGLKIEQTTNYGKFKTLRGNRPVNEKYLSKLAKSIQSNNMLPENPILVNRQMMVIDGQHRLQVAEMLSIPVYYIVLKTGGLREVQQLNTNVRGWTTKNFLESYIALGKKDYEILKDFSERNNISLANAMMILNGGNFAAKRKEVLEAFRNGDYKITQPGYAKAFVKKLNEVSKFLDSNVRNDRNFIRALETAYKTVSHDKLMEKFVSSGRKVELQATTMAYVRELENVLSYKTKYIKRIGKKEKREEE